MEVINYELEVRRVYPSKSDIDIDFYYDKVAKENLWHVDIVDYKAKSMREQI